jgi:hypothetical protein
VGELESALRSFPCYDLLQKGNLLCIFWTKHRNWMPCQKAWRVSFYKVLKGSRLPIQLPKDGNVLVNEEKKKDFGSKGCGSCFCPFQCELCHFRNLRGRSHKNGMGVLVDTDTMDLIIQASLDAFWSREPATIGNNLAKINGVLQIAHELGLKNPPVPILGPWPVEDNFGMGAAIVLLKHPLGHGVTETEVQYSTVRKMKSALINIYHASVENQINYIVRGRDGKYFVTTDAPIYSEFFGRFQAGMHNRMGDKVVQDFGFSRGIVQKLQEVMEGEWINAGSLMESKMEIAKLVMFVMIGYAQALRGEVIPNLEIAGLLNHPAEGDKTVPTHIMLSLVGRFKQEDGEMQHFLSVTAVTGSELLIPDWVRLLLELKVRSGQTQGLLFRREKGSPAKTGDFDEPLIERLVWIQDKAHGLIPMTIGIWEVVGSIRSMRRGKTT